MNSEWKAWIIDKLGWVVAFVIALSFPVLILLAIFNYEQHTIYKTQIENLQFEIYELRSGRINLINMVEERVKELEQTVYGKVEPGLAEKKRPVIITTTETWQRNRDAEIKKQISGIMQRLNELENIIKDQ